MSGWTHSHMAGSRKPYLMQWVLQQEAPRKQVLLQIFSGTPERECAHRMHMTLEQVREIERWCAEEGPRFVEDDYEMSYYAANDCEEFCRVTGQGEGIYRLMELRYPKERRHPACEAAVGRTSASCHDGDTRSLCAGARTNRVERTVRDDMAARMRRDERRAAREQERERRREEETLEPRITKGATASSSVRKELVSKSVRDGETASRTVLTSRSDSPSHRASTPSSCDIPRQKEPKWPRSTRPNVSAPQPNENRARELAAMVDAACEHCAEAFARPISFAEFLAAFRRERVARGWTAEAVPSDVELRRVIGCDYRVMWTGTDEFWFLDWKEHTRTLAQAIERNAIVGREYSTRYFYRKERRLMRRLQIKTPEELYEVLRRIYVDAADEAVFGNHLSFGFGNIDRQKQVKHFVTSHPGEPKNILAMEYERAYGFSAGTAEIWLDLFAQTSDSSLSEWIERKTVGEVCAGEPKLANDAEIERELACESQKMTMAKSSRATVSERPDWIVGELIAASVPYVDNRPKGGDLWVIRSNDTAELVERLRTEGANFRFAAAGGRATRHRPAWWVAGYPEHRELTAEEVKGLNPVGARASKLSTAPVAGPAAMEASRDCDAATERAHQPEPISMPAEKMTGAGARTISVAEFLKRELTGDICDASLIRARFSYEFPNEPDITEDSRLLSEAGYYKDHGLLFGAGLTSTEHFNRLLSSSPSFSKGDPGFEEAVWKHPTFRHVLRRALTSHRVLLYERPDSYISFLRLHEVLGTNMADIATYAPTVCRDVPAKTPFTIRSLREALGFIHPLDGLDMPDAFYEGLLDVSGLLRTCTMAGTRVFITGIGERFSASMFIEWLVSRNEGISREDVPRLLQRDYGIDYPMASVITAVYHSTVYHDDVGDAYYSSMEVWKQEARNELNKLTS